MKSYINNINAMLNKLFSFFEERAKWVSTSLRRMSLVNFIALLLVTTSVASSAHGVVETTATLTKYPNNMMHLAVEFDFIALLNSHGKEKPEEKKPSDYFAEHAHEYVHANHKKLALQSHKHSHRHKAVSAKYSLPVIAGLDEQNFARLYQQVIKLFDTQLQISLNEHSPESVEEAANPLVINRYYPSAHQVHQLLKLQFSQQQLNLAAGKNIGHSALMHSNIYTDSERRFYQKFSLDFRLKSEEQLEQLAIIFPRQLGKVYLSYQQPVTKVLSPAQLWKLN